MEALFLLYMLLWLLNLYTFSTPALSAGVWNNASDQQSLLGFKAQIKFDPSNFLSDWSPNTSFCKWRGVICFSHMERVRVLNLSGIGFEGVISPLIGNLSALESLDLSQNALSGSIPPQLGRLSNAKEIILADNHLQGDIPASLSGCSNLVALILPDNRLQGSIPAELSRLRHLQSILLQRNFLTGTIPVTLGNLSSLIELALGENNLTGSIPVEVGMLNQLIGLYLHTNLLSGAIPSSVGNISSLTFLYLSLNSFTGPIPHEIRLLTRLQFLSLQANQLSGTIPSFIGNLSSLIELALEENNLTGAIPIEVGRLTQLTRLYLNSNQLSGTIPSFIGNLSALIHLVLYENTLTGSIPAQLGKLTNLTKLFLWGNQLSEHIPNSIGNYSKLKLLILNSNLLSGMVPLELGKLPLLKTLMLSSNELVSGNSHSLAFLTALTNCSILEYLEVSENHLTGVLPTSIGHLSSKLTEIHLGYNKISGSIPQEITKLTNLTYLGLQNNIINGSIPSGIKSFRILERLLLRNNKLEGNISDEIGQLKSLGLLDISGNKLSGRIPDSLGRLEQLRRLFLHHNRFSGVIPVGLSKIPNLEVLDFSHNFLRGNIPGEVLVSLKNLQFYLNLSGNVLEGPLPIEISKIVSAQAIDLSHNQIGGEIPSVLGNCIALEHLNLSHNALEGPIPDALGKLINLQDIDLSSNFLSGAIPMSLTQLKVLRYINISFNNLTGSVPEEGFFSNSIVTELFMGNPSLCGPKRYLLPACPKQGRGKHSPHTKIMLAAAGISVFILCSLALGMLWKQKFSRQQFHLSSLMLGKVGYPKFSYQDIFSATNGFSETNLLGEGNFGSVYKGILRDGREVAIKVLNVQNEEGEKIFKSECNVLGRIRHRNLIRVISACSYPGFKGLVLQYAPNGSLEKNLYPNNTEEDVCGLGLAECLGISIDVAHALEYLHHDCFVQVVHCDLKPSNVLVDANLTALVTDFGISRLTSSTNSMNSLPTTFSLRGSIGYISPEYGSGGTVSIKGDVYSFGILLLEMVTRKRPTDSTFAGDLNLRNWVRLAFPNRLADIVDRRLFRSVNLEQRNVLVSFIHVGLLCTKESAQERPTIRDVARGLERLGTTLMEGAAATSNSTTSISFLVRNANASEGVCDSESSSY